MVGGVTVTEDAGEGREEEEGQSLGLMVGGY